MVSLFRVPNSHSFLDFWHSSFVSSHYHTPGKFYGPLLVTSIFAPIARHIEGSQVWNISLTSLTPFSFDENSSINFTEVKLTLYVHPAGSHPRMGVIQLEKVVQNVSLALKWAMALFQPRKVITSAWTRWSELLGMTDSPFASSMQTKTAFVHPLRHLVRLC